MQTFAEIQFQIGAWSLKNFGLQETPYLGVVGAGTIDGKEARKPTDMTDTTERCGAVVVELNELAPLMGIAEELGEFATAFSEADAAAMEDALGDIAIYLCDYCCRVNTTIPSRVELKLRDQLDPMCGVTAALGRLFRANLKHHQRIREFHDMRVHKAAEATALIHLVWHLEALAKQQTETNLLTILNTTWNNIVSKRDWRADAVEGGGHSHREA